MKMQISIERSFISGFPSIYLLGLVFLLLFFGEMLLFCILPFTSALPDNVLAIFAFLSCVAFLIFLEWLDEKHHSKTENLQVILDDRHLILIQRKRRWNIPFSDIKEVIKCMKYDRIYTEKGKYKIVIKRKNHRSLTFMTTEKEYESHCDFEHTELAKLYNALRNHGIKCC